MRIAPVAVLVLVSLGCGRSDISEDLYLPGTDAAGSTDGTGVGDGGAPDGRGGVLDAGSDVPQFGGSDGNSIDAPSFEDSPSKGLDATSDAPGSCGDCDGCCQGTTCIRLPDETATECGWVGAACQACPASYTCAKGTCITKQPSCGPSNCSGCCDDANTCSTGIAGDSCGFGGNACQACESCVLQPGGGGSCPTCESCHGCCDGTTCLLGILTTSCGTTGEACAVCGAEELCKSQGASAGGVCQPACAPSNCAGCCEGNVCAVGTQDIACGVGGEACTDCTTSNELCTSAATCG